MSVGCRIRRGIKLFRVASNYTRTLQISMLYIIFSFCETANILRSNIWQFHWLVWI